MIDSLSCKALSSVEVVLSPKLSPPLKFYSFKTLSSIEDLSSPHEGMV
uniref:Uncharacterized protein n=1 Tax=Fagus sylvatica TaxID=28930 RepID=A0A2N9FSF5_FAGSY